VPWPLIRDGWHDGYNAPFAMRFLPTASEQCRELILLTLGSEDGLHRVGDGGVLHSDLADGGELLQRLSNFKTWTGSLLTFTACSYVGSMAPNGGGKSSSVAT
jgi:hypothetical protein